MPSTSRATHWLFTVNYRDETLAPEASEETFEDLFAELNPRFLVCQRERGVDGTLHDQGYVEFTDRKTLLGVRRLLPRAHWEPRRGTRDQAREYSRKEDTRVAGPWEFGRWELEPGRRTDILALKDDLAEGATDAALWENHFSLMWRGFKATSAYRLAKGVPRPNVQPLALVYWGFTGTGKSRRVRELVGEDAYWVSNPGRGQPIWFDGYMGQRTIVFDDFYGWMPWSQLLRLLDRNPYNLNLKGSSAICLATTFMFTSNSHPSMWYPKQPYGTLERRIDVIECEHLMWEYRLV